MGPWDPNWRPDPTGRRLLVIRAARRGALAAALIFGALELLAMELVPPIPTTSPEPPFQAGFFIALFSLPGLALLGAGLTSAALGSRGSAASAGLAMGVGVPVAAVTSAMIGAFILGLAGTGAGMAGTLLRSGVTAAVQISPLIAVASVIWVLVVRRLNRSALETQPDEAEERREAERDSDAARSSDQRRTLGFRRGRGPRRPGG